MLSCIVDGEVLDFHYRKFLYGYTFYIGDILIGQIFDEGRRGWAAVAAKPPTKGLNGVHGFRTRYDASEYLLRVLGYHK